MALAKLFGSDLSPFVAKVARALELKGIPFELVEIRSPGDLKRADLAIYGRLRTLRSGSTPHAEAQLDKRPELVRHFERVKGA